MNLIQEKNVFVIVPEKQNDDSVKTSLSSVALLILL